MWFSLWLALYIEACKPVAMCYSVPCLLVVARRPQSTLQTEDAMKTIL